MISTRVGPLQLCSQADNDDNWLDQFFISAYEESATALQEVELQHTPAATARVATGSTALATEPEPGTGTDAAAATPPRNTYVDDAAQTQPRPTERYAAPVTDQQIIAMRDNAVPKKTAQDTMYCIKVWKDWSNHRICTHNSNIPPLLLSSSTTGLSALCLKCAS